MKKTLKNGTMAALLALLVTNQVVCSGTPGAQPKLASGGQVKTLTLCTGEQIQVTVVAEAEKNNKSQGWVSWAYNGSIKLGGRTALGFGLVYAGSKLLENRSSVARKIGDRIDKHVIGGIFKFFATKADQNGMNPLKPA
jgi:hypothetical protein